MTNNIQKRIGSFGKQGTTFLSFSNPLRMLCAIQNPDFVMEFGPGYSTSIFLEYTGAKIISIEDSFRWYLKHKLTYRNNRLHIIYKAPRKDLSFLTTLSGNNPLVFIDGSNRLSALEWAFNMMHAYGSVYLHDAHREDYEKGIRLFPFIFFPERHSAILCKQRILYLEIKENIKVDYSCACQYCSSPARRAYFNRFAEKDNG